jgi:DNA-binding response OmpR family regulator
MLPGRDGYAVCEEIRASPAWRSIRIIMLTARGGDVQREKGISLGADEYVTKPFSTRELAERVRRILDRTGLKDDGRVYRTWKGHLSPVCWPRLPYAL